MPASTIEREEGDRVHEFVLRIDGERRGSLEYTRPGDGTLRIEYVEVAPDLRGSGLGRQLVAAAVTWSRELDLKIVPICPYAAMVLRLET